MDVTTKPGLILSENCATKGWLLDVTAVKCADGHDEETLKAPSGRIAGVLKRRFSFVLKRAANMPRFMIQARAVSFDGPAVAFEVAWNKAASAWNGNPVEAMEGVQRGAAKPAEEVKQL